MKLCSACHRLLDEDAFYLARRRGRMIRVARCRACDAIAKRGDYQRRRDHELARVRAGTKRRGRPPMTARGRVADRVRQAVTRGRIVKPSRCEGCGESVTEARLLHAHHRDYNKPFEVVWLCPACHGRAHRKWEDAA